ncbi:hypothetical protein HDV00_009295 [Rhizophlyctis rosea]|nr:hypothetical protein HDV00_009295 [Rhizophlyctis rosea]
MLSNQFGDLVGPNVSNDADNFFQSDRDLELQQKRAAKQADTKAQQAGEPIQLPSKILSFVLVEPARLIGALEPTVDDEDGEGAQADYAYVAESGHVARKVNLKTKKVAKIFKGHTGPVTSVSVIYGASGEDEFIVTGSWDQTLRKWDVKTKSTIQTYTGHTDFIKRVIATKTHIYSASSDSTIRKWDTTTGETLLVLKGHGRAVEDIIISPDGKTLLSASSDTTIKKWNTETGELLGTWSGHLTSVYWLAVDWYEGVVWSASADKTVKRWDLETGESDTTLTHPDFCKCVQPVGGAQVATGSRDETVRLWDVAREKCIGTFDGHFGEISALHLRGATLWTASLDGTIRRWNVTAAKESAEPKAEAVSPPLKEKPQPSKNTSALTEEEERELAELMGDDDEL